MTRIANARLAGVTFLAYIATAFAAMTLLGQATSGDDIADRLATIAQHAPRLRLAVVLSLVTIAEALVLAVSLHAVTRDEDPDLALLALTFRVGEGAIGAIGVVAVLGLLWLATAASATIPDAAVAHGLGTLLLRIEGWSAAISAFAFSVGSALFAWLFVRSRSVPVALALLGVGASVLLVAGIPAQLLGLLAGPVAWLMWLPMLLFEVALGLWLLIRGVAPPRLART